jgi:uncharacterized membrane protein
MELVALVALVVLAVVVTLVVGSIMGIAAMSRVVALQKQVTALEDDLRFNVNRLERLLIKKQQESSAAPSVVAQVDGLSRATAQSDPAVQQIFASARTPAAATEAAAAPTSTIASDHVAVSAPASAAVAAASASAPAPAAVEAEPLGAPASVSIAASAPIEVVPAGQPASAPIEVAPAGQPVPAAIEVAPAAIEVAPAGQPAGQPAQRASTANPVSAKSAPVAAREAQPPAVVAQTSADWWSTFEEKIGKRWATWAGALAIFLGMGFFVRLAVEQEWIGPWGRVGLGFALGVSLLGAGLRFILRRMRPLGQGLVGGGLAVLYTVVFASYGYYHLVGAPLAFLVMAAVTALGVGLAVRLDARPIAFLAVLGGLVTPLLLWTGLNPGNGLFAYLLVLDLGVLLVAMSKRWRALDLLAAFGTWGLFALWSFTFRGADEVVVPMLWVSAFFLVFLALPLVHHLRKRTRIARERLVMALSSGCVAFSFTVMFAAERGLALGLAAVAVGLAYLVAAFAASRRISEDGKAILSLISMATAFLTMSVPLLLDFHAVTIAWAVEGVLLVYLGYRYQYLADRVWGMLSLALAVGHLIFVNWPLGTSSLPLINIEVGTVVIVALAIWAYARLTQIYGVLADDGERVIGKMAAFGALALVMVGLNTDLWGWLEGSAATMSFQLWLSAALWLGGAILCAALGWNRRWPLARAAAFALFFVTFGFTVVGYALGWSSGELLLLNGRFAVAFVGLLALLGAAALSRWSSHRTELEGRSVAPLVGIAMTLGAALLSVELWQGLSAAGHTALALQLATFAWLAAAGATLAWTLRGWGAGLRWLSLAQIGAAALLVVKAYGGLEPTSAGLVLLNLRFLAVAVGVSLIGLVAHLVRREALSDDDADAVGPANAIWGVAGVLLFTTGSVELFAWVDLETQGLLIRTVFPLIWSAGAVAMVASAYRFRSLGLRHLGLVMLLGSVGLASWGFTAPLERGALLVVNERFLTAALVLALCFVYGLVTRRWPGDEPRREDRKEGLALYGIGGALAVVLLSFESFLYFEATIADPDQARWVAQMALSIVWAVCAVAGVAAGFMRRERGVRLAGLALFAITAAKLLIVDTASVAGGYRIVSFMVVGLLMIGASYLYHRLERRLAVAEEPAGLA